MRQKTNENEKDYVWHDGVRISAEQLLSMAKNAGSYALAEHYLCSLMAYAAMNQLPYYINKMNEVREHYQVIPIPVPKEGDSVESVSYNRHVSIDDMARKKYGLMSDEDRRATLRVSLQVLIETHRELFERTTHWIGIYLVIRDRLDSSVSKRGFKDFAKSFTPECWPVMLAIGVSTMSNFSHYVNYEDRFEAYYDMDHNPWEDLCNVFWNILKQQIMG
jgi:hypothetical protein